MKLIVCRLPLAIQDPLKVPDCPALAAIGVIKSNTDMTVNAIVRSNPNASRGFRIISIPPFFSSSDIDCVKNWKVLPEKIMGLQFNSPSFVGLVLAFKNKGG
jgi:hypothetical protein